nr:MAG TPA: hypothetical protein [Caudoviricetes sp.]
MSMSYIDARHLIDDVGDMLCYNILRFDSCKNCPLTTICFHDDGSKHSLSEYVFEDWDEWGWPSYVTEK